MKRILLVGFLVVAALLSSASWLHTDKAKPARYIVVSKQRLVLSVVEGSDTVFQAPVGCGKNMGNKQKRGDNRTPEGTFHVKSIEKASHWTHDFSDGAGQRKGAYGDWFIRLDVPHFNSIGIHGTCFPESIGTRCSEGCIRLRNEDLNRLKALVFVGMKCIVEPD